MEFKVIWELLMNCLSNNISLNRSVELHDIKENVLIHIIQSYHGAIIFLIIEKTQRVSGVRIETRWIIGPPRYRSSLKYICQLWDSNP